MAGRLSSETWRAPSPGNSAALGCRHPGETSRRGGASGLVRGGHLSRAAGDRAGSGVPVVRLLARARRTHSKSAPHQCCGGDGEPAGAGAAGAPRVHACGLVGRPLRGECVLCAGRWVRAPGPWAGHSLAAADREGPPRVGDSHLSGLSHFLVTVSLPDSPRPPCRFSRPTAHCPRAARVRLALVGAAAGAFLTQPPNLELGPSPAHLGG